ISRKSSPAGKTPPIAFITASLAAKRAARCSSGRLARRQYSSSRGVNMLSSAPAFSASSRSSRATETRSMPVCTCCSASGDGDPLCQRVDQVVDGEQLDDVLGPQLAAQGVRVDLRHRALEFGKALPMHEPPL